MIISCPECKNQVSDQADSCPHCGIKMATVKKNDVAKTSLPERKQLWKTPLFIVLMLIVAGIAFFSVSKSHDDELAAKEQQVEFMRTEAKKTEEQAKLAVQNAETEAKLANQRADEEARLAAIPELPVSISTRNSLLGSGIVAVIENNSSSEFAVIAEFTNPGINATKTVRLDLPAKSKVEVGHLEGWRFQSGDTIKLSNEHYKELFAVVP